MASISYEVSKFNPQPSAELLCAICFCVLHEARMCPCHHIFCHSCISQWLENNHTCPTCRRAVSLLQLELAPPLVQNVLNSLTMDCDYKDQGCDQRIAKENFPSHIGNCDYRPVPCPHKDCSMKTPAHDLSAHTQECQYRSVQCHKRCMLLLPAHEMEKHDCFSAMQNRVHELDGILHKHQLVLQWIRLKLNNVQLPEQSPEVQLQAYQELLMDINQYWPEDQLFPLRLCGNYIAPSTPATSGQSTSTVSGNEVDNSALEQLVAKASDDQNRPRVFGTHDPDGADGPTAPVGRDTSTRGIVYEVDLSEGVSRPVQNDNYVSDDSETWGSSTDHSYPGFYPSADGDGGNSTSPAIQALLHSQYLSPDTSVARGSRRQRGNTQGQDRDYLLITHSPERSRSGFDEYQSYRTLVSSDHDSSNSDQDNMPSVLGSMYSYSRRPQPSSYRNADYDRQHHDSDSADPLWNFSSPRREYGSHYTQSHYYSRSRSVSLSPRDENYERDRHSGSYSPRVSYSPRSDSYSPRSPGQSSENSERSYSASQNRSHSRSRSRSGSTTSGRSSSRSPDHQARSCSQSSSSSQSFSSTNQASMEHLINAHDWGTADEGRNIGSTENHDDWTTNWDHDDKDSNIEQWSGSEGRVGEVLDEYESFTPVPSPSQTEEDGRQVDSTNTHSPLEEVVSHDQAHFSEDSLERAHSKHNVLSSSSEQMSIPVVISLPSYALGYHSEEFQERRLKSDVSQTASHEQEKQASHSPDLDFGHQTEEEEHSASHSHPDTHFQQASCAQDNIRTFENTASGSRIAEERLGKEFRDIKNQDTLEYPTPSCSYIQNSENGTLLEKTECGNGETADDGSHLRELNRNSVHLETAQNVWESSSNTTSLDYDIPAEELTPKPASRHDSGSECSPPNTGEEHGADYISGQADNMLDQGQTPDAGDMRGNNRKKTSTKHGDHDSRNKSVYSDSDENTPDQQTNKQSRKKCCGKGKALKTKRKKRILESEEESDSNLCLRRKAKVRKLLDTPSDSADSAKETETNTNQTDGDDVWVANRQISLPSTSQGTATAAEGRKGKGKRKREKKSDKKISKSPSSKKVKNDGHEQKLLLRLKRLKSPSHPQVKKARHNLSVSFKENGAAAPNLANKSAHVDHPNAALTVQTPNPNNEVSSHMLSTVRAEWSGENPKRSSRSHTFSQSELSERADNGVETFGLNCRPASSRGRRHSQKPMETEGRRDNERRVVESASRVDDGSGSPSIEARLPVREAAQAQTSGQGIMRIDGSRAPSIAAFRPEREAAQVQTGGRGIMRTDGSRAPNITFRAYGPEKEAAQAQTGGRRTMRTDNVHGRMETRQNTAEESTRTVLIADLPVPPSTLELLNRYDNSDESDYTWSAGSSETETSSTV